MAGEDDDAFTQEEIDALDETPEGAEIDEDATGLDDEEGEGEEGDEDRPRQRETSGQVSGQPTRAKGRIGRLKAALDEVNAQRAKDREDFQRQIAELRQAQGQPRVDPELEAARIAAMSPEERIEYRAAQSEQRHAQEMQLLKFQMADNADAQAFRTRCATDARAAKYAADVDKMLGAARQAGMNPTREIIYYVLLGQKVANAKTAPKQRQQGEERLRRQTTRTTRSGSDTSGTRGGRSLEQRLDGVQI